MTEQRIGQTPLERVLELVEGVEKEKGGYKGLCPAHEDRNPSLGIKEGDDGRAIMHCRAGCETKDVLEKIGLDWPDLFLSKNRTRQTRRAKLTATWEIRDRSNNLMGYHLRFDKPDGTKECKWKRPDGSWGLNGTPLEAMPLYGAEQVDTWPEGTRVVIVEGEPAKDALDAAGIKALATVTGAKGTPSPEVLEVVRGRPVCLWPDNDSEGRDHMSRVASSLQGIAEEVRWFEWADAPEKGDAAEHPAIKEGDSEPVFALRGQMSEAPLWEAPETDAEAVPEVGATGGPSDENIKRFGLIKLLADEITNSNHFARDAGGKLYRFSHGIYKTRGEEFVKQEVKRLVQKWGQTAHWSTRKSEEVAAFIAVDAPELWERPPTNAINLLNGILDVNTRKLGGHDPGFLSTTQIPVRFDPEATCPEWDKFISSTFPEDATQLAYEIPADLMLPERSIQKAILLIGEGSNGKSTFLDNVSRFIGSTNIAGLSLQKLQSDRFSASRLVGKLANICPDLPSTHLTETSLFKAITGGDTLNAEYKYRESFEFKPFCRLVFSANQAPRSQDASHAFFRRWVVVPFDRTFEGGEEIPRHVLDARLSDAGELSGLLNKALDALPSLRARGFTESATMREAWEEFHAMTDPVSVWLDKYTIDKPDKYVSKVELRDTYNRHCNEEGRAGMGAKALTNTIKRIRPTLEEGQRTVNGKVVWCWLGIGLASGEPDPIDHGPGTSYSRHSQHSQDRSNCLNSKGEGLFGDEKGGEGPRNNNGGKAVNPVNLVKRTDHPNASSITTSPTAESALGLLQRPPLHEPLRQ